MPPVEEREVQVQAGTVSLEGNLGIPADAQGIVLFAHGSGSSRKSPRNRFVSSELQKGGLATLLFDLLTPDEEQVDLRTRRLRFDISLLGQRVVDATDWLSQQDFAEGMRLGYFGASTGAAAALLAAAKRPEMVYAVVSRGGRPDLAGAVLSEVRAYTLLIVGGEDQPVIDLNQQALEMMRTQAEMKIIPGATHLFEEPGALKQVADLGRDWFRRYLLADEEV